MKHLFASCDAIDIDLGDVHRCFDVLRAEAFVASTRDAYERDPASLGPNTRANYEMGAAMTLLDSAWAQAEQTRILARFQKLYEHYDVILAPTTPVSPFAWTQLFASHINGEPQANYYRWLALTYVTTLTTHPALSLPCGLDDAGHAVWLCRSWGASEQTGTRWAWGMRWKKPSRALPGWHAPRPDLAKLRANTRAEPALTSIATGAPDPRDARSLPRDDRAASAALVSAV